MDRAVGTPAQLGSVDPSPTGHARGPARDPRSRVATRTATNLATALGELRLEGMASRGVTRLVTRAVVEWAEGLGWLPVTEMPLAFLADTPEYPGRQGIVDVYIARRHYRRDLVVEIDRGNKVWSARKLGHAVANGKAAIWIRWSGSGPIADIVPGGVEVIYLHVDEPPRVVGASGPEAEAPRLGSLSGSSRLLVAALYGGEPPPDDPGWLDDDTVWRRVGELRPRIALVLRCRYGRYGPRALTLNRTAEVVADEFASDELSCERIRQLEAQGLRQLRARTTIRLRSARRVARLAAPKPVTPPSGRAALLRDETTLTAMVADVVAKAPKRLRPSEICYVLRGSTGRCTQERIATWGLPHAGVLSGVPYRDVWAAVLKVIDRAGIRVRGRGRLRAQPAAGAALPRPVTPEPSAPDGEPVPGDEELRRLVIDILSLSEPAGITQAMLCHVLRGSRGPVTRELVERCRLPHDGALRYVAYRPLYDAVGRVLDSHGLRLADRMPVDPPPHNPEVHAAAGGAPTDRRFMDLPFRAETPFERMLMADTEWQAGADWGAPRSGHPEGAVKWHIGEVLANLERLHLPADDRRRLRIAALVHDTFKYWVDHDAPRVPPNEHGFLAARWLGTKLDDPRLCRLVEIHDEGYRAWRAHGAGHDDQAWARISRILGTLGTDIGLFVAFYWADNRSGDKEHAQLDWFVARLAEAGVVIPSLDMR